MHGHGGTAQELPACKYTETVKQAGRVKPTKRPVNVHLLA